MFLTNENSLVIASAPVIVVADTVYQVGNQNYIKQGLALENFDLPVQYEAGWCTYHNGAFTTIPKPKPEPSEQTKQAMKDKCKELEESCERNIELGIDYVSTTGLEHYTLTKENLNTIKSMYDMSKEGSNVPYKSDNGSYRFYTPAEMAGLFFTSQVHQLHNKAYTNLLQQEVNEAVELYEVQRISFGIDLSDNNQSKLNALILEMQKQFNITI